MQRPAGRNLPSRGCSQMYAEVARRGEANLKFGSGVQGFEIHRYRSSCASSWEDLLLQARFEPMMKQKLYEATQGVNLLSITKWEMAYFTYFSTDWRKIDSLSYWLDVDLSFHVIMAHGRQTLYSISKHLPISSYHNLLPFLTKS